MRHHSSAFHILLIILLIAYTKTVYAENVSFESLTTRQGLPDPSLYNGLFNLLPNLSQILFHSFRIFVLDNFEKILQLRADIGYLPRSAWVE